MDGWYAGDAIRSRHAGGSAGRVRGGGRADRDLEAAENEARSAINDLVNGLESIEESLPESKEAAAGDAVVAPSMHEDGDTVRPMRVPTCWRKSRALGGVRASVECSDVMNGSGLWRSFRALGRL